MDPAKTDCNFFLTNSCTKGDACHYRHNPAVLSNPVICKFWLAQGCWNVACPFRHPQIGGAPVPAPATKDRSQIPCYWETQPSGCAKGDACPFLHKSGSQAVGGEEKKECENSTPATTKEGEEVQEKGPPASIVVIPAAKKNGESDSRKVLAESSQKKDRSTGSVHVKKVVRRPGKIEIVKRSPLVSELGGIRGEPSSAPVSATPKSFGVKSFQEIIKEKGSGGSAGSPVVQAAVVQPLQIAGEKRKANPEMVAVAEERPVKVAKKDGKKLTSSGSLRSSGNRRGSAGNAKTPAASVKPAEEEDEFGDFDADLEELGVGMEGGEGGAMDDDELDGLDELLAE